MIFAWSSMGNSFLKWQLRNLMSVVSIKDEADSACCYIIQPEQSCLIR